MTAKNNAFFEDKQWLLDTPKVIRQQAAFEAAKNFKSAFSAKRNGTVDHFQVQFKSKRTKGYVLGIEKQLTFTAAANDGRGSLIVLPESIGAVRFFEKPPIDTKPGGDCSVMRDAFGDFWLLVPVRKAVKQRQSDDVLSIDPGIRQPFSCFSPTRCEAFFEGGDMKQRIDDIQRRVQRVDVRLATPSADKKKLKAYRQRLFRRYKNVRDDCHWKIISSMTDSYGTILLPELAVQRISGSLRAKSNREMFGISHYLFRQRMAEKCQEKSVVFQVANEAYTSKTCGRCGHQNDSLGSSEVFWCPRCGLHCHRDLHAARNIYIRWLAEQPSMAS